MFFIAIHALSIQLHYYCRLQIRLLSQAGLQIQPNENNKVIPNIHHDGVSLLKKTGNCYFFYAAPAGESVVDFCIRLCIPILFSPSAFDRCAFRTIAFRHSLPLHRIDSDKLSHLAASRFATVSHKEELLAVLLNRQPKHRYGLIPHPSATCGVGISLRYLDIVPPFHDTVLIHLNLLVSDNWIDGHLY